MMLLVFLLLFVKNGWSQRGSREECLPGYRRSLENETQDECLACAPGKVASRGKCFLGTELASYRDDNGRIQHHAWVRSYERSCYAFIPRPEYWTDAEAYCHNVLKGHLVCVSGQNEARFLSNIAGTEIGMSSFWIGLNERGNARAFDWSNPQCCSEYRNWYVPANDGPREPNEDLDTTSSRCVRMASSSGHFLFDDNCRTKYGSICQAPVSSAASTCTECRKGTYAPNPASTECLTCPFGKYADRNGATNCISCPQLSPAHVLSSIFGTPKSSRVDKGQGVRCGGQLGPRQRSAYLATCVLAVIVPLGLAYWTIFAQARLSNYLVRRGLALWPTSSSNARRKIIAYAVPGVQVFGAGAGAMIAVLLEPMNQRLESWPYKGRRNPSTLAKGCNPAKTANALALAITFLIMLVLLLIAAIPVVNVVRVLKALRDVITRYRLRRRLKVSIRKTHAELKSYDLALQGKQAISGYSCALCGQNRANCLNLPCRHQIFCMDCTEDFRQDCGREICSFCQEPSEIVDVGLRRHAQKEHSLCSSCHPMLISKKTPSEDVLSIGDSVSARETTGKNLRSVKGLREAIAETRRVRAGARQRLLASTCGNCSRTGALVVNLPCGHACLCAECAAGETIYKDENGSSICPRCMAPIKSIAEPVNHLSCSICYDIVEARHLVGLGSCGHTCCSSCSVYFIRSALNNVSEMIHPEGLPCPGLRLQDGFDQEEYDPHCKCIVSSAVIERLVNREVRPDMQDEVLPLSPMEFDRLNRFIYEANIPVDQRFFCCHADCARMFPVEDLERLVRRGVNSQVPELELMHEVLSAARPAIGEWAPSAFLNRLFGSSTSSVHRQETFAVSTVQEEHEDDDEEEENERLSDSHDHDIVVLEDHATQSAVGSQVTSSSSTEESKGDIDSIASSADGSPPFVTCPFCSRRSCVRCKTPAHALLSCQENQEGIPTALASAALIRASSRPCPNCGFATSHPHGHSCHHIRPGTGCPNCSVHFCIACLRPHGISGRQCSCRLFCDSDAIIENVVRLPFPHDARCKCPICPDCERGKPCSQCSGSCVVCLGVLPPGPKNAADVDSWFPELEKKQEGARRLP